MVTDMDPPASAWAEVDGHEWAMHSSRVLIRRDCARPVSVDGRWLPASRSEVRRTLSLVDWHTDPPAWYRAEHLPVMWAGDQVEEHGSDGLGTVAVVKRGGSVIALVFECRDSKSARIRAHGRPW